VDLLKLLALFAGLTLAWVVWQNRYRFVRRSPQGSTRTKLSRSYTVQRDFLERVSPTERMKLVALAYAACGFDPHHYIVYATARELSDRKVTEVKIALRRVFGTYRFSFGIDDARGIDAHYQRMCSELSTDVEFLRIYLEHKLFFERLINKLTYSDSYFAFRNPDVVPNEDLLQLLWTENLERP
jgi:hypothetical protein